MATHKWKRLRTLGLLAFGAALLLAVALPVWWPWILRPLLASQDVRFGQYERAGYARGVLREVRWEADAVGITAERVETALPASWLWRKWSGDGDGQPLVSVQGWRLEFYSTTSGQESKGSLHKTSSDVDTTLLALRRWLPSASATNGVVRVGTNEFHIREVVWRDSLVAVAATWPPHLPEAQVWAKFHPPGEAHRFATITVQSAALEMELEANLTRSVDELTAEGFVVWHSNRAELAATFAETGWLPQTASVRGDALELPGVAQSLPGYQSLRGEFDAHWQSNHFEVELTARAEPVSTNTLPWPSLNARLRAVGDSQTVRLENADLTAAGLDAKLTQPVEGGFTLESWRQASVVWRVSAALARQPWLLLTGNVTGEISVKLADPPWPDVRFALSGTDADGYGLAATNLALRGDLRWPLLRLEEFRAQLTDGPLVGVRGESDFEQGRIIAAEIELRGSVAPAFLSADFSAESLVLTGRVSGPFGGLTHTGHLAVANGVIHSNLPPVSGEANWRGTALVFEEAEVALNTPEWSLALGGFLDATDGNFAAQLAQGTIAHSNLPLAALVAPARILVQPPRGDAHWQVRVEDFHARGPGGEIQLNGETVWPRTGRVRLAASGVEVHRWQELGELWRDAQVERCELEAAWDNGPLEFNLRAQSQLINTTNGALRAEVKLQGGPDGIRIEQAQVIDATGPALTASGTVPVTFTPVDAEHWWRAQPDAAIDLQVNAERGAQFWEALATWTGVKLQSPHGTLSLHGTLANLQGRLQASAAAAEFPTTQLPLPKVEALEAQIELTRTNISLAQFTARVEDQPVRVTGELPLSEDLWERPTDRTTWPNWEQAHGRLIVPAANVSAFVRFLPDLLSPQGTVNLDLTVQPGGMLRGELTLADAATRGWLPMGPIRDVKARLRFADRRAVVEEFTGQLAGRTVSVAGHLDWPEWDKPGFSLRLDGERVPLAREPGLILRGDVNLLLASTNGAPPALTGTLRLRDSFYLAELRSLLPGRAESPQLRPPYFSITEQPFAGWKLDVKLTGERGLRVRTPLFRGELSPDLRLSGTLREPRAVGEVRINAGRVQFPFASIGIEQSRILLTSDNPYRPELFIEGTSRAYDYDVRLSVTGFADAPVWEMSSNPPLSPEAIVLMVTAGEVPRDRVTFTERQRAGRLMFFLGKSLFSELWLDDTVADRLIVRSGESVTSDGRETYSVEYILTDRWSLVGEYDQFNALNAGIKWQVYSK
jgi:translocation and assembly module TamB